MTREELENLLAAVAAGDVPAAAAADQLRMQPFADLGFAKVDHHRGMRQGVAEVVYGEGKTPEHIAGIVREMLFAGEKRVLVTRIGADAARRVQDLLAGGKGADVGADWLGGAGVGVAESSDSPELCRSGDRQDAIPLFTYYDLPRLAIVGEPPAADEAGGAGGIVVACGGTSDIPVAEEAALTAEFLGNRVVRLYDVGVAGLHRLLAHTEELACARVVVAVAGMEGALASVIGGLVSCPVIAVPTSVGYGASLGGVAALLAMLNSCASGVSVVNIDNGFGAGYQASLINRMCGAGDAEGKDNMELRFDFTKGARRQDICEQLKAALGDAAWEDVQAAAAAAGVPEGHHHGIVEVRETIGALRVPDDVKRNLGDVYEILAQAEATVHECAVDDTHFHEVGNGAAILNALVICLAFHRLAPDRVVATPVQAGSGTVECAHGLMAVPAPATAAILAQGIPVCEQRLEGELCTPTSAAIIKHFVDEFA